MSFMLSLQGVIKDAIDSAMEARKEWERMPHEHRAAIFQKVADLITGKYRIESLAATMVGQVRIPETAFYTVGFTLSFILIFLF